jgi:hypothetical protein
MTPGSAAGLADSALGVGRTWTDPDGAFSLSVDSAGAAGANVTVTLKPDVTPPAAFTLASPADGATVPGPAPVVRWNPSSDGGGLRSYEVWLDGRTAATVGAGTTSTSLPGTPPGAHTWWVVAVDMAGNRTSSPPWHLVARSRPPADFDGDGRTDVAVFRPLTGAWYVKGSSGVNVGALYGLAGDIPVPGDYDGDGRADVAVFRPLTGTWYVRGSSGADIGAVYGAVGDIPVPGDYDGDGRTDVAVFRPSNGSWYVKGSSGANIGAVYGASGDVPVPGDYDGDGRTDVAVFRPSNGSWYVKGSTGTLIGVVYGAVTDIPLPLLTALTGGLL